MWTHLVKQYIDNSKVKSKILGSVNVEHIQVIVVLCILFIFVTIQVNVVMAYSAVYLNPAQYENNFESKSVILIFSY